MIKSGYFNSINGDRKYNSDTMSSYFSGLISKGVLQNYLNKFVVSASSGMNVQVETGKAFFTDGKWIESDSIEIFTIEASDVILDRIDRIVLRKDKSESSRSASIVVKKGTPSSSPVAPSLEIDENIEELSLATIYVGKLVESISQSKITDTRADSTVCGFVTGLIDQVDTSDLYKQFEASFSEEQEKLTNEFDEWFSQLREQLSTSTLLREYTNRVFSSVQDQRIFSIGIPNYVQALDILEVYVNGLRLVNNVEYIINLDGTVTLTNGLDINQPVEFVVFKSVDGNKAETVIEQVENLQNDVAIIKSESKSITKAVITLPSASWVAGADNTYTQTVPVEIVKTIDDLLLVSPIENINIRAIEQAVGSLTFEAYETLTTDIHVNVANLGV